MSTKLEKALEECPWYDYHTIEEKEVVVRYDHCGCGCDEHRSIVTLPIVNGEVVVNNKSIKITSHDKD